MRHNLKTLRELIHRGIHLKPENIDYDSLKNAIVSFDEAIHFAEPLEVKTIAFRVARAGVIQNFEFTYELCWKFLKRRLEADFGKSIADGLSRKELFRLANKHRLIENVDDWFAFHEARNETSHTYDAGTAQIVYQESIRFIVFAKNLYNKLIINHES